MAILDPNPKLDIFKTFINFLTFDLNKGFGLRFLRTILSIPSRVFWLFSLHFVGAAKILFVLFVSSYGSSKNLLSSLGANLDLFDKFEAVDYFFDGLLSIKLTEIA